MPRIRIQDWLFVVVALVLAAPAWAQEIPPAERLLPNTTKGAFIVRNTKTLTDQFNKTQLGTLLKDPVMEPFSRDLHRQCEDRLSGIREKLGLTLDDLKGVPSGEVTVAIVRPRQDQAALVILMDVTGHQEKAKAMLEKAAANQRRRGAKETQHSVAGTTVILFELPKEEGEEQEQAVYFLSGNLLGAADHLEVLQGALTRFLKQTGPTLADVPAYRYVADRLQKEAGDVPPQVRWFIEPIGYIETLRIAVPEERLTIKRKKGQTLLDIAKKEGFEAIQGAGGYASFAVNGYELLHHTAVFAPKPYKAAPPPYKKIVSMDMLTFPNATDFAPLDWIPGDVATQTTFYWNVLKAFDNLGPTFDALIGEGETEVFSDVLDGYKNDPNGPRIDVRNELVALLGKRVTVISDYQLPVTTTSERLLFAIEARDEKAVAAGVKRFLQNDATFRPREFEGHVIWETVEEPPPEIPDVTLDAPSLTPGSDQANGTVEKPYPEEEGSEEEKKEKLLPHIAITAANGHLLIASHVDFLMKILKKQAPIGDGVDYRLVDATMQKLAPKEHCLQSFSRTDEEYRPTYELIRMNKMPESETMFGRFLNVIFGTGKKGVVRKQKIDGRELPDYQVVRRYLGPAGVYMVTEEQGWSIGGFMLPK